MSETQKIAIQPNDLFEICLQVPETGLTPVINHTKSAIDFIMHKSGAIEIRELKS